MQATDNFTQAIQSHLTKVAEGDPLFATTFQKPNKNIKDCCTYIMNEVKKSGCNGLEDEEVYAMAIHYYDEDDIKPGAPVNCKVVVNQKVEGAKHKMAAAIKNRKHAPDVKKADKKVAPVDKDLINQISLF